MLIELNAVKLEESVDTAITSLIHLRGEERDRLTMSVYDYYESRKHSPVSNYVIPGLTSYLIGDNPRHRLFQCSRNHQEVITPHGHRFSLLCRVIKGKVTNRTWFPSSNSGDEYAIFEAEYKNKIGSYSPRLIGKGHYGFYDSVYDTGSNYFIHENSIHSIWFSKDTTVFVEELGVAKKSNLYIEPIVNGIIIPTMEVKPWMFAKIN